MGRRGLGSPRAFRHRGVHRRHPLGVRARFQARDDHSRGGPDGHPAPPGGPPRAVPVPRRRDPIRRDARAAQARARGRVLPHRDPGPVQGDPELPEDDGQGCRPDVSADWPHGIRSQGETRGLDGAPPLVLRPRVAVAELGTRRRPALEPPAANLLQLRGAKALPAELLRPRQGEPPRRTPLPRSQHPRAEPRLHPGDPQRQQRRAEGPAGVHEGEEARG